MRASSSSRRRRSTSASSASTLRSSAPSCLDGSDKAAAAFAPVDGGEMASSVVAWLAVRVRSRPSASSIACMRSSEAARSRLLRLARSSLSSLRGFLLACASCSSRSGATPLLTADSSGSSAPCSCRRNSKSAGSSFATVTALCRFLRFRSGVVVLPLCLSLEWRGGETDAMGSKGASSLQS